MFEASVIQRSNLDGKQKKIDTKIMHLGDNIYNVYVKIQSSKKKIF